MDPDSWLQRRHDQRAGFPHERTTPWMKRREVLAAEPIFAAHGVMACIRGDRLERRGADSATRACIPRPGRLPQHGVTPGAVPLPAGLDTG